MQYLHSTLALVFALTFLPAAQAQDAEHRLGEHPAVIVKRMWDRQPYDYVSKFYPHPAWLFLRGEASGAEEAAEIASRGPAKSAKDAAKELDERHGVSTQPAVAGVNRGQ